MSVGAGDNKSPHEVLAHHALVEIRCDHERGLDMPVCNCALIDLGWHPTVQAAKEAWARHALGELGLTDDVLVTYWAAIHPTPEIPPVGDNKTLPERLREGAEHNNDSWILAALLCEAATALEAAERTLKSRTADLLAMGVLRKRETAEAEARLVAVEAERDEWRGRAERRKGQPLLETWEVAEEQEARADAAEARVVALEAENAELKGLKAGGDCVAVAVAEAGLTPAEYGEVEMAVAAMIYVLPAGDDARGQSRALLEAALAKLKSYPHPCDIPAFEDDPYTMGLVLCDPDGIVRKGRFHKGVDYPCTSHAHFGGEHIECLSEIHARRRGLAAAAVRPQTDTPEPLKAGDGQEPELGWNHALLLALMRSGALGELRGVYGPENWRCEKAAQAIGEVLHAAVLASSEREKGEGLGGSAAARSGGDLASDMTFCWLVERGQAENHTPTVWFRRTDNSYEWTQDPWLATRFATKKDAEAVVIETSAHRSKPTSNAVEHGFATTREGQKSGPNGGKHHGRVDSSPPYVGGDDDEITGWRAICDCGWKAEREWDHVTGAHIDLVRHLNEALTSARPPLAAPKNTPESSAGVPE